MTTLMIPYGVVIVQEYKSFFPSPSLTLVAVNSSLRIFSKIFIYKNLRFKMIPLWPMISSKFCCGGVLKVKTFRGSFNTLLCPNVFRKCTIVLVCIKNRLFAPFSLLAMFSPLNLRKVIYFCQKGQPLRQRCWSTHVNVNMIRWLLKASLQVEVY